MELITLIAVPVAVQASAYVAKAVISHVVHKDQLSEMKKQTALLEKLLSEQQPKG